MPFCIAISRRFLASVAPGEADDFLLIVDGLKDCLH
jgi:hypothetical protein